MIKFSSPELDTVYQSFAYEGYDGFINGIHRMIMKFQNIFQLDDQCVILGNLSFLYYYSYNDSNNCNVNVRNFHITTWNEIIKITDTWKDAWNKAIPNHKVYYPDPITYFGDDLVLRLYGQIVK